MTTPGQQQTVQKSAFIESYSLHLNPKSSFEHACLFLLHITETAGQLKTVGQFLVAGFLN